MRLWLRRINRRTLVDTMVVIGLMGGFVVNAPIAEYMPSLRNILLAMFVIFYFLRLRAISMPSNYWLLLVLSVFTTFFSLLFTWTTGRPYLSLYLFPLAIALSLYGITHKLTLSIKIIILINLLAQILELVNGDYIISNENVQFELGRYQGLFSYSKETSFFLIFSYLLLRKASNFRFFLLPILLSALLTGSRTSLLFIGILALYDYLKLLQKNFNKGRVVKLLGLLVSLYWIVSFTWNYLSKNIIFLRRILNSFEISSSGHQDRIYFINKYVNNILDFDLGRLIFGSGLEVSILVRNGSETTYLDLIAQLGLLGLSVFCFALIIARLYGSNYFLSPMLFLMVLGLMVTGRIALGWADGVIFWALILSSRYDRVNLV